MSRKPKIFIGSSTLAVESGLVDKFIQTIGTALTPIPWFDEPQFRMGSHSTLSALLATANKYDFAAFLFTPDDTLIRPNGEQYVCARDNVIFECGMFLSTLGPDRVFTYRQNSKHEWWILTDIHGIQMERINFEGDDMEKLSAVRDATRGLVDAAGSRGFRRIYLNISDTWWVDKNKVDFIVQLDPARVHLANIGEYRVCAIANIGDPFAQNETDQNIGISALREIRADSFDPIILKCQLPRAMEPGECANGAVVLVPREVDIASLKCKDDAVKQGCRIVHKPKYHV